MKKVDPITLAVVRNYLVTTAREMRETVQRTAFSTVIYEDRDFACGILDSEASTVAEAPGLTHFMGALSPGVKECLKYIGKESINPGDIFISTMPNFTGSHPSDATMFYPLFYEDRLFGFAAGKAHLIDIGAMNFYPTNSTDAFQEGLRLPPVKLYKSGELDETIMRIIKENSRAPEVIWGDIHALIAAFRTADASVKALVGKYGSDTVTECVNELFERSEMVARAAIQGMPEGTWTVEDFMDDNGVDRGKPVEIKIKVTVDKRDNSLIFDYTGSAPEQRGPTNSTVICITAFSRLIGKVLTSPNTVANEGSFRPIKVIAPEGSIMNPSRTAPTMLYCWPGFSVVEALLKLLAPIMPDKIPACSGGDLCGFFRYGIHPQHGELWIEANTEGMGQGAHANGDGENALVHIAQACSRNLPVEIEETHDPELIEQYELIQDSGGCGKFRGGLGLRRDYRYLADGEIIGVIERGVAPHWGVLGGKAGRRNYIQYVTNKGEEKEILKCPPMPVYAGELISNRTGGGGGYGSPLERDPEVVLSDVINEYVSLDSARSDYGVVIDSAKGKVDREATSRLRAELADENKE